MSLDSSVGRAAGFDHHDSALADRIHAEYHALRSACPVGWSEKHGGFWVVTGWQALHDLARDAERLSSRLGLIPNILGDNVLIPISLDPPEHSKYRELLQRWFTPTRVGSFEDYVRERARALLGGKGDVMDLALDFARPLPLEVILTVIGVPEHDMAPVAAAARAAIEDVVEDPIGAFEKIEKAYGYLAAELVPALRQEPGDDLISFLTQAEVDGAPLADDIIAGIAFNVVGAGFDTTYKTIASSVAHLASDPASQRELRATADLSLAIEELLRLYAPVSAGRILTADVACEGQAMQSGEAVLLAYPAAGRDPCVFDDPDVADFTRQPNKHLAFGTGIHRCLGMHLARLELRVALEELFAATSWFELEPDRHVTYRQSQVWGATSVPAVLRRSSRDQ